MMGSQMKTHFESTQPKEAQPSLHPKAPKTSDRLQNRSGLLVEDSDPEEDFGLEEDSGPEEDLLPTWLFGQIM